jgi:hypothetical protein
MPERLHGETEDRNESNSSSSLVSHSVNPRIGKIGTQEVFGNTATQIIRVIISATFRANPNDQRKPKNKLLILDGRIVLHHKLGIGSLRISRTTKSPSDPIGDNLLPVGGPVA